MPADIVSFIPRRDHDASGNLDEFVASCRDELTVFGKNLDWSANYWSQAKLTFGNIDQTGRVLKPANVMKEPFLSFAKAYVRYQQGQRPSKANGEIRALRCLERALCQAGREVDVLQVDSSVFDMAGAVARDHYSPGMAYHAARELARLAKFISDRRLAVITVDWENPIKRPVDTVRTGKKAQAQREKKLPRQEALDAIADIFASKPHVCRDIFTTCVSAMLMSVPSRVTEVLALPVDCEVWETKRDGSQAYGWRFTPGKGGAPMIKWIPTVMVDVAREAVKRVHRITDEARRLARWLEEHPGEFYRHSGCSSVAEDKPLTVAEAAAALGIPSDRCKGYAAAELRRRGLPGETGFNTLTSLNRWVHAQLPEGFPWFDKTREVKFSQALFCLRAKQLRTDMAASPVLVWKPTNNVVTGDLQSRETSPGHVSPSIYDRHGRNDPAGKPLKLTSHQFRHLLNTIAQRGGLGQAEIARWSGRAEMKQNRVYDHMSEFELAGMLRSHDPSLKLDRGLDEIADRIRATIPMSRREFNTLTVSTAHVTESGFCAKSYIESPCQKFRDCTNCTEHLYVKGDKRLLPHTRDRLQKTRELLEHARQESADGTLGSDRWVDIHKSTEQRLTALLAILEDDAVPDGSIIRLANPREFSPFCRALEARGSKPRLTEVIPETSASRISDGNESDG
jgi:hypothetical protein